MSFQAQQVQVREEAILDSAFQLMLQHGFANTSMDDIAAAVGISKATLYHHFNSKEELTLSMVTGTLSRLTAQVATLDRNMPPLDRLAQGVRILMTRRLAAEEQSGGKFSSILSSTIVRHSRYLKAYRTLLEIFSSFIDEAKERREVATHVPTRVLAQALMTMMRDFDYSFLRSQMEFSADALIDAITSIFLYGILLTRTSDAGAKRPRKRHKAAA